MITTAGLAEAFCCGDENQAEAAARQLAAQGSDALPELRRLLADERSDVRWWAVRALAEIPGSGAELCQALHDPAPDVRQCAALALRVQPQPQALESLLTLLDSPDDLTARLAGEALAALGQPATPALLNALQTGSQRVRMQAVRVLAQIGDQRSIPALFQALDDPSAWIEYWANEGLERMGVGMTFFKPT